LFLRCRALVNQFASVGSGVLPSSPSTCSGTLLSIRRPPPSPPRITHSRKNSNTLLDNLMLLQVEDGEEANRESE
jgi:hypothetical protein